MATTTWLERMQPARILQAVGLGETRLATSGLWIVTFLGISAAGGLGDHHPGQYLPFWSGASSACQLDLRPGCENVVRLASASRDFARGHPDADELPIVLRGSKGPVTERDPARPAALGCSRGWAHLCGAGADMAEGD